MNRQRTWKERDRWNTVAYQTYRDSREWRHLLELNPAYDIRYRPAAGVNINIEGPVAAGKPQPSGFGIPGQLRGTDTNLDLRGTFDDVSYEQTDSLTEGIWPWDNEDEYLDRLGEYTAAGLFGTERFNGYMLDSPQAKSDTQR